MVNLILVVNIPIHHVLPIPDKVGGGKTNRLGFAQAGGQVGVTCGHTVLAIPRLLTAGVVGVGRTVTGKLVAVGIVAVQGVLMPMCPIAQTDTENNQCLFVLFMKFYAQVSMNNIFINFQM